MKGSTGIVLLGAGGHARVVISTITAMGRTVTGVYDDSPERRGTNIGGIPILGPINEVKGRGGPVVIAIGDNAVRARLAKDLGKMDWLTVVHPFAWVDPTAEVGRGAVVFAGAVVQPHARLGNHTVLNTSASIDHDVMVGDFAQVAPGAHVAGGGVVGEGAFIGTGAVVNPGVVAGPWSVLGSGGVATKDIPSRMTVVGVPARPLIRTTK